jgi:hypothetical protein
MPQQNGGDGWRAFQRLANRYDDPQKLEEDLAELEELRRRSADQGRSREAPGQSSAHASADPISPRTVAEVLQLQDRGLIDDHEVRRLLGLAGSSEADLHQGWRDTIRDRAGMGWRGRGGRADAPPPPWSEGPPPPQAPPPQGSAPPPRGGPAPPPRSQSRDRGRRFLPSLGVGGPPDYVVHRLGWGIIWRFAALAIAYVFPTQAQKVAIVVGLLLLAFLVAGAYLRWWRRSDLTGTVWRLALAAGLAVGVSVVGLPAVVILTVLTFGCLLMLADVAWTVLWPWMGEDDEPGATAY